ncbi:MAG: restriction endonuclease subunit S [Anaerotignum lactatifermentans]
MKSEYIELAVGISKILDYRGKTPQKLGSDWVENGVRVVSAKNVHDGKLDNLDAIRCVTKDVYEKWMKEDIQRNDILLASEGASMGESMLWESDEKIVLGQRLFCLRCNTSILNPYYLAMYMRTSEYRAELVNHATGTSVLGLRQPALLKTKVRYLPIESQNIIGEMYRVILSRIDNNKKINDNLQQQAQTLFREWFIDNPDAVTWKEGTFSDLIEKIISGDWGKDAPSGNNTEMVYCIRGADIPEVRAGNKGKMPTRYILPKNYAAKQLVDGDIVVEISGGSPTQSTGRAAAVSTALLVRYDKGMVCTNFCKALKPVTGYSMYVYHYWLHLYNMGVFFSYENGTTGIKNLDITGFIETEPILIAPADLVEKFDAFCQSIFAKVYANGFENEQLALIRDTLLPKLMTGEVDVSEIEI